MDDDLDITEYTLPKTDQLNADDLLDGPITVTVTGVKVPGGKEQPVHVYIDGYEPWKPCLTCRKLLKIGWGGKARHWKGHQIELYRDPKVNSPDGTKGVGGVRIKTMSHMAQPIDVMLPISRGKKKRFRIPVLKTAPAPDAKPSPKMKDVLKPEGLTVADVDRWLVDQGKPTWSEHPEAHNGLINYLTSSSGEGFGFIRALVPAAS